MIEYHADDYGLFPMQSGRILETIRNGACNGISIMPNSPFLEECMEMLRKADPDGKVRIAVHLNLVEGKPSLTPDQVDLLTDDAGVFANSFGRLMIASLLPGRKRLKKQIEDEFTAQIHRCRPYLRDGLLCLDSHTHIHMIPMVFDAMLAAAEREKIPVFRIRIPREEWSAYRIKGRKLEGKTFINCIKSLVLNLCARWILSHSKPEGWRQNIPVFAGVLCSGRMDWDVMEFVAPKLAEIAALHETDLELLFHPGSVLEENDFNALTFQGDRSFLSSENRKIEADTLKRLGLHAEQ